MSAKPRLHRTSEDSPNEKKDTSELFQSLKTIKKEKQEWIIPQRLPVGAFVVLEGIKGAGKSTLCAALAAMLTGGRRIPPARKVSQGDVLWLTGEEDAARSVRPRLEAAGADVGRVHQPRKDDDGMPRRLVFPGSSKVLQDAIVALSLRMVILDPLSSHLSPDCDVNSETSVRPILEGLARLAAVTQCLILGIRHLRKDRSGPRIDQGLGSVGIGGVARMVLALDQPDARLDRRVLRVIATNLGAIPSPLEYHLSLVGAMPTCDGWRVMKDDEDDPTGDQLEPGERDTRGDARVLLRRLLCDEWVSSRAVLLESEHAGISPRTLRAAKAELGVRSRRIGTSQPAYWEWGPPKEGW